MTNNNMFFIANWKMHGNTVDIAKTKSVIKLANTKKYKKHKIIYCPPYTLLNAFYKKVKNSKNTKLYTVHLLLYLKLFIIR